jgi:hypothetical protein
VNTTFFLGANTPGGFASYYGEWLETNKIKRLYIIKGTPGNGKSGFMRRVAKRLGGKGAECESILCSSDPGSLDGVYFPGLGVAFADGAPPHVWRTKTHNNMKPSGKQPAVCPFDACSEFGQGIAAHRRTSRVKCQISRI